jgi:DNA invertase Pin-like site-specific DNA recombinase
MAESPRALIGYARVSHEEQAASGYGLKAQEHTIRVALKRRGWKLNRLIRDEGVSGKSLERPGLIEALKLIAAGEVDGLVVAKLDRLSRSVIDFALLLEWFEEAGATLLALDLDVDTSTPGGRLVANVFASVAEWERDTIAQRTSAALAAARAAGRKIGPGSVSDNPKLLKRIQTLRDRKLSLQAIADELNHDGVPTVRGGAKWRVSSVQSALGYRRRRRRRRPTELPALPTRR